VSESDLPVLVVGGINMDIRFTSDAAEYTRRTSNPAIARITPGGVARNIAHNLAILSVPVRLAGVVGDDGFGQILLEQTAAAGVDVSGVEVAGVASTGLYCALLNRTGLLDTAAASMVIMDRDLPERFDRILDLVTACSILVADTNLAPALMQQLISAANARDIRVVIDPVSERKAGHLDGLNGEVFLVTPNEREHAAMAGTTLRIANTVITRGERGATWIDPSGTRREVTARACRAVDETGAGDAFCATLVAAVRAGISLAVGLEVAAEVATCVAESVDSSIPSECAATARRRLGLED